MNYQERLLSFEFAMLQNRQISNPTSGHPTSNLMNGSPSGRSIASMTQLVRTLPVSPGTPLGPIRVNIVNNRTNSPQTTRVCCFQLHTFWWAKYTLIATNRATAIISFLFSYVSTTEEFQKAEVINLQRQE